MSILEKEQAMNIYMSTYTTTKSNELQRHQKSLPQPPSPPSRYAQWNECTRKVKT